MSASAQIKVFGIVQGVGFRWFVRDIAKRFQLSGWVRNNPDSTVEIEVEGEKGTIEAFINEVKIGPRSAKVTDLKVLWSENKHKYKDFEVGFY